MRKFTKRVRRRGRFTKRGGGENAESLRKKAQELVEKAKALRQEAKEAAEEAKKAAEESDELFRKLRNHIRPAPAA
jgi:uncharacterized coiled-coil DUF342 family protein